jgi:HPt (histidine-containing phosphotransfer) domain-containing protein
MAEKQIDLATFEELKQMSGADFIGELVRTFLEDAPKLIGELKSALKAGDADAFRRAAHSLKSNGATFGARRLSEQARELESLGKEGRLGETGDRIQDLETTFAQVAGELKGLQG